MKSHEGSPVLVVLLVVFAWSTINWCTCSSAVSPNIQQNSNSKLVSSSLLSWNPNPKLQFSYFCAESRTLRKKSLKLCNFNFNFPILLNFSFVFSHNSRNLPPPRRFVSIPSSIPFPPLVLDAFSSGLLDCRLHTTSFPCTYQRVAWLFTKLWLG